MTNWQACGSSSYGSTGNHWIVCKQNIESNRSYGFYINAENRRVMPSIHADWHFEGEVGEGVLGIRHLVLITVAV
ncbi:MAG: hypothetical protein U5R30_15295 [Deltaproteobacteria bacterium]|nr:hypothetical protein [Deltaproteobacteria bacterium]